MTEGDIPQLRCKCLRLLLAMRRQRDIRTPRMLAGKRPFGFTVSHQINMNGIFHTAGLSSAASYSPLHAMWLHLSRYDSACCAAATLAVSPRQISNAGCCTARAKENAKAQGNRDLNCRFMAFNRAEANSADCPPDKNVMPWTAAGTVRNRQFTVASATAASVVGVLQAKPGSTILGFNIIPSSSTRWACSCWKTMRRTCSVTVSFLLILRPP